MGHGEGHGVQLSQRHWVIITGKKIRRLRRAACSFLEILQASWPANSPEHYFWKRCEITAFFIIWSKLSRSCIFVISILDPSALQLLPLLPLQLWLPLLSTQLWLHSPHQLSLPLPLINSDCHSPQHFIPSLGMHVVMHAKIMGKKATSFLIWNSLGDNYHSYWWVVSSIQ